MHTCSFLAVLNAEKDLAERASTHTRDGTAVFSTALRVDDDHTPMPSTFTTIELTDLSPSPQDTLSVTDNLIVEEPRKSHESTLSVSRRSASRSVAHVF